jgi:hypothetical protein
LWVRVGGEGYDIKIVDGCLWVKASSAITRRLNAPSPFSEDGYLNTGDGGSRWRMAADPRPA